MKNIINLLLTFVCCIAVAACDNSGDVVDDPNSGTPPTTTDPEDSFNLTDPFSVSYPEENDTIKYSESFTFNRTIYVDPDNGDDLNDGLSESSAIKTLAKLPDFNITHGDAILLKGGVTHYGTIILDGVGTSSANYIRIGSYGGSKARLNAAGEMAGIYAANTSNIYISDLKITANGGDKDNCTNYRDNSLYNSYAGINVRCGIYIINDNSSQTSNITLYNLDIRDIFYYGYGETPELYTTRPCKEWSTSNEDCYGWGVKIYATNGKITGLDITECNARNVSHTGFKITGNGGYGDPSQDSNSVRYAEMVIDRCIINETGAPSMMVTNVKDAIIRNSSLIRPGSRTTSLTNDDNGARTNEPRKWGRGSGLWMVRCDGLLFEKNHLEGSEGTADCCGAHIDIANRDIIIQYCLSKDNAGGFIEVLGKNYNCSYRYNVSINDGWRNDSDEVQQALWDTTAMTDGFIVTINGHDSGDSFGPFYTYVYNNTIVATEQFDNGYTHPMMYEYEMSANGILMANNIFWIPTRMSHGWSTTGTSSAAIGVYSNIHDFRTFTGTAWRDMTTAEIEALNYEIKNNLYMLFDPTNYTLDSYGYPETLTMPLASNGNNNYWDENPLGGDPGFKNYSATNYALTAEDLIPTNAAVINRGIAIEKLSTDTTSEGLDGGLSISLDYFGNTITTPIVGAIVPQ